MVQMFSFLMKCPRFLSKKPLKSSFWSKIEEKQIFEIILNRSCNFRKNKLLQTLVFTITIPTELFYSI